MKILFKLLAFILIIQFTSCEKDDSNSVCNGNCTTIKGKIVRADNSGIEGVEVIFSYVFFAPYSYRRVIAKTKTDENGNYEMQAFLKDSELGTSEKFQILVDKVKIENSLTANYLKPSELLQEIVPKIEEIIIPGIENRNEIINVPNFKVPYKTDLTIKLNNYISVVPTDSFGFEHRVEYGFENQYILCKNENSTGLNSIFNFTTAIGNNRVRIFKWKNNVDTYLVQDISLTTNPSNQIVEFEY
jgi:hypothetical protein